MLRYPYAIISDDNGLQGSIETIITWLQSGVEEFLKGINDAVFFSVGGMPLIVPWLIFAGVFFTLRMKFVNVRAFKHAIDIVRGTYSDPSSDGEISHFQALAVALSGTVGVSNIFNAMIAIALGGPGALFWMTVSGLLSMTTKFTECTLAVKYRTVSSDGTVRGGPMYYLSAGLASIGQRKLGRVLAVLYSFLGVCGILVSISIPQSNQSLAAVAVVVPMLADCGWIYGLIMALLVGVVILGGIQSIARVAGAIVPLMCGIYILASLWVLLTHITAIPEAIGIIISSAFSPQAVGGGFLAGLVQGLRRSAFSNGAGSGMATIAHATAKTSEPVREGIVALLEPFIDTVIICNLSGLVLLVTGAYNNPKFADLSGTQLASAAFGEAIGWFPYVLAVVVFFFAFSTLISLVYYGQVCWEYLLGPIGEKSAIVFKLLFLMGIFLGSVAAPEPVLKFGDAMYLTIVLPNIFGLYFLYNQVAADLEDYFDRLKVGFRIPFVNSEQAGKPKYSINLSKKPIAVLSKS
ncbi:MAG: alanine/glycine:cation symporter family protein [Hormoscilla sp.]